MVFLYPEIDLKNGCFKCQACVKACPSESLTWEGGAPILNRERCKTYVLSQDECLECAMACRRGLIKMVKENQGFFLLVKSKSIQAIPTSQRNAGNFTAMLKATSLPPR